MKSINLRRALIVAACGIALIVAALGSRVYAMQSGAGQEPPINPPMSASTAADWKNGFDIQFRQVAPPCGSVRANDAAGAAVAKYGTLLSAQYAPDAHLSAARCGRMTMGHYYRQLPDGTREYPIRDRLVWVLTYRLANVPYTGPPPPGTKIFMNLPRFEAEANVVVDAKAEQAIDMFTISRRMG